MHRLRLATLSFAAFATIAPSIAADEPKHATTPCVFVSQIDHFQYVDDKTAILETSPNKRFRVTFFNACRELRWAVFARIEARPGTCLAAGDKIVSGHGPGSEERCMIETIEQLPPNIPKSADPAPNQP
ncbi:MAG: hypothetical protein KBA31_06470 [Alphaproteobacteria bacterium]|nr:hypothetical protein [Alphaproteobacteria bacterium]